MNSTQRMHDPVPLRRVLVITRQKDIHSNSCQPSVVHYSTTYMTSKSESGAGRECARGPLHYHHLLFV